MAIDVDKLKAMGANSTPSYPEAMRTGVIRLQDDSDGNGVYIREWNHPDTQPSDADIDAVTLIEYHGANVAIKSDVDNITKKRIMSIFGSLEGELKYMREMITGVHDNSKNLQVQAILDEGNAFIIDNNLV